MPILNQQLTTNFSLYEMLSSQTATRLGFQEQFDPPPFIVENLRIMCEQILQPLRNALGYPLKISSGYRCPRLNTHIKGAPNSQHMYGQAVDLIDVGNGNAVLFETIKSLGLPFDQMIDEFGLAWVHVSYDSQRKRHQMLKATKNSKGQTVYISL